MSSLQLCRCCMTRPPDKNLKTQYIRLGVSEVYADMIKECFEIHLETGGDSSAGICEVCVTRLCDAADFKKQVQECQRTCLELLTQVVKEEEVPKVKEEIADYDDNGIYFLDLKEETEELSDFEVQEDADDDKKLAELLGLRHLGATTVRRKARKKDKLSRSDKKQKKLSTESMKISFKKLSKLDTIYPRSQTAKRTYGNTTVPESVKHKTNMENLMKNSNCTPFANKTLAGILCAFCKEVYQNPQQLRIHIEDKHKTVSIVDPVKDRSNVTYKLDISDLKCTICNKNFDLISSLKSHLTNEHDVKFYPDVHDFFMEFKLTDTEMLKCALCNSSYETFKMLLQHMNGHYRNFICEVCDLGYINKHKLKNHQRTHETGNFKCSFCDKEFTTRVRKMCHEKYTHNTAARYTTNCPQCEKSFTSYYQRNRHMFTEHNTVAATYKCNICDKSFILKAKLTSHIKKVHLMERNHICSVCGQGFFIKQSLEEHMIKHNGERVFKCTVCHKAYARKKTLREHMRIHNNDRRFKCGMCGLAFVQKCSMKSHMLSNHGITLAEYEVAKADQASRPESAEANMVVV